MMHVKIVLWSPEMKKRYNRRDFIKVGTAATITSVLFPSCTKLVPKSKRIIASTGDSFDYIVVGSGAGGGPLACRLVEAGFRVLLLEAGGENKNSLIEVPAFHGLTTEEPELSWEFFVNHYSSRVDQIKNSKFNYDKNGVFYPRATGLGGCTIHNAMIFMYPDNSDWDHLANITSDKSWNSTNMRRYFQRMEANQYYQKPRVTRSIWSRLNLERMGFNGWMATEQTSPKILLKDKKFLKIFFSALKEEGLINEIADVLGEGKNIKLDPNTWSYVQNKLDGVFNVPKSTLNGKRSSARDYILKTQAKYPFLLTVKTDSLVKKVIFDQKKKAIGVEVLEGKNIYKASPLYNSKNIAKLKKYKTNKEVILAGGAFNSPQLLMLSGVGDPNILNQHGIETLVTLPGVGKNLQDRYEVTVVSKLKNEFKLLDKCSFNKGADPCLVDYKKDTKNSLYATNGILASIIKRSRKNLKDPDLFMFALPGKFKGYYKGWANDSLMDEYLTWAILKGHNENHSGVISLNSSSPQDMPDVNFNYFHNSSQEFKKDLVAVRDGVKFVRKMNNRISSLIDEEISPGIKLQSHTDLDNWIQNESWGHHASCSNKIGSDNDDMAVLDSKFRVRGTKGLRVVDASSFNRIPGMFIVCPIYMIAEKAAEDIVSDSVNF